MTVPLLYYRDSIKCIFQNLCSVEIMFPSTSVDWDSIAQVRFGLDNT